MTDHSNRSRPLLPASALRLTAFAALATCAGTALAQASAATDAALPEVVVSASGFEQDVRQAPASISVVTRQELETRQYRDLAEALQNVEGIDVGGGTGKTGGLDISIRGMPSEYTLILIDGRRQNVAGDVTPNGFGAAHTSLIPPLAAIERIEVIRGPMSTLYGSDAMGGVINIITRKVARQWGGQVSAQAGIPEDGSWGQQYRGNFYLSGPIRQDMLGLAIRGDVYEREASDYVLAPGATASGRNPAPAASRQHTLGARLTLTPSRQHDLWLDVEQGRTWYDNSDGRLGNRDALTNLLGNNPPGYRDFLRFNRDQIAIGHTARLGIGLLESSLMRNVTETIGRTIPGGAVPAGDPRRGTDRELETTNTVLDTKLVAPLGESHVVTVGGQWWDAELVDGLLPQTHSQTMWSLFAEDEWKLGRNLTATLGARYDDHSTFGGHVSPRAYLVWTAQPTLTIKGGVSRGFRAPRLNQLIDGVSGVSGQGATINIGNPTLKPETSTSTEISAIFDNLQGVNAAVTLFHNQVDDKISSGGDCATNFISSCAANPAATYSINVDEARTWGLELSTRLKLSPQWSVRAGYTWTNSEVIENGVKNGQLANTARHLLNAQVDYDLNDQWRFWLRGEYRGKSPRFTGDPAQLTGNNRIIYDTIGDINAYALFHLGGSYKVSKALTFNANIYNLFDKDFRAAYREVATTPTTTWVNQYFQGGSSVTGTTPVGRTLWITGVVTF
ncbi:MAG: TonB-dependent receptor [Burkholderiaceae bacterium]|nr:TonB-dependent receptor [Burkholderiaceae bacterium]